MYSSRHWNTLTLTGNIFERHPVTRNVKLLFVSRTRPETSSFAATTLATTHEYLDFNARWQSLRPSFVLFLVTRNAGYCLYVRARACVFSKHKPKRVHNTETVFMTFHAPKCCVPSPRAVRNRVLVYLDSVVEQLQAAVNNTRILQIVTKPIQTGMLGSSTRVCQAAHLVVCGGGVLCFVGV